MRALLPLFLDLRGSVVVISGETPAAHSFAKRCEELGATVRRGGDVEGAAFVATGSFEPADDASLVAAARSRGLIVVDLHSSKDARAFVGESAGGAEAQLAATTLGGSAELERRLVSAAASTLRPEHEGMARILRSVRGKLEERFPDEAQRANIWRQIIDSPVMVLLESGQDDEALEMAERMAWGTG